jgi:hypothetical protein
MKYKNYKNSYFLYKLTFSEVSLALDFYQVENKEIVSDENQL